MHHQTTGRDAGHGAPSAHFAWPSRAEEIANSLTHGAGLLGSLIALPILLLATTRGEGDGWHLAGSIIYGASLILLYGASTLYHALREGRAKEILRVLDHSAIYLLIAGSYTPFMLGALRGPWGWSMLAIVWTLALVGIVGKWTLGFRFPWLSTALYLGMGWLIVVAMRPLMVHVPRPGLLWLAAGGLCYTGGVVFYARDQRMRFGHAVWHLFVLGGSVCHYVAVLGYAT
ncbi:MAG: hemolysin [Gemmatimonadetes bacterium]|jgi:hemolysin III|nr:hemolysin [Gemmatimonadota bacterium]